MNDHNSIITPKMAKIAKSDYWPFPAVIAQNNFIAKSLSDFSFNAVVGCLHDCLVCSVPSTSTNKMAKRLKPYGIEDPQMDWGSYALVRPWDKEKFLKSLEVAENTPDDKLKPEGHRAVIFSSTTDAYQLIRNEDPELGKQYHQHNLAVNKRALELIRDKSTLNVRILTRSPLAKLDFELFKSFGHRLTFGMSLPTLNDKTAKIYEPGSPGVTARLKTLKEAKKAGLNVYVAVAPVYADCDEADIRATLKAIAELEPLTVFHEPVNIRAENVARTRQRASEAGATIDLTPFESVETWRHYAVNQLKLVERIAGEEGLANCLHLWPDKSLADRTYLQTLDAPTEFVHWLRKWWTRISEWPEAATAASQGNAA